MFHLGNVGYVHGESTIRNPITEKVAYASKRHMLPKINRQLVVVNVGIICRLLHSVVMSQWLGRSRRSRAW